MLRKQVRLGCLCVLVALALPLTANAGFRCQDGNLILEGDSAAALLNKCGKPLYQSNIVNREGYVIGQRFTYQDRIDNSWIYVVDTVDDKVTKIEARRQ